MLNDLTKIEARIQKPFSVHRLSTASVPQVGISKIGGGSGSHLRYKSDFIINMEHTSGYVLTSDATVHGRR